MKHIILATILMAITIGVNSQSNVIEVEYFLDVDNGFGLNTVLDITSPEVDITETIMANIPMSTSIGYHKLYIRTKDEDGNWSQTIRKNIEVFAPVSINNIVMGEYFIDEDSGFETTISFAINPEAADIEQEFIAQIPPTIALGYHKLYGRVQDSYGNWSHTFRKNIEVYLNPVSNVVEIEYFFDYEFDLEFGNNNPVSIAVPEIDGAWDFNILSYPVGNYDFNDKLFVRVKDSNEKWSITTILDEIGELSIKDNLFNDVSISPNPFTNEIEINSTRVIDIELISVYDITGKTVYKTKSDLRKINLDHLESGTYILSLQTENEKATFKIIKR